MDLEGISEELASEFQGINDDFTISNESVDDFNESEGAALSLEGAALSSEDADMDIQDRESMDVPFDGSCCTLGPKNIPCWKQFSQY